MNSPEQNGLEQPLNHAGAAELYGVLSELGIERTVEQMQRSANPGSRSTMEVTGPYCVEHEFGIADPDMEGHTLVTPVGNALWGAQETRLRVRRYVGRGEDGSDMYEAERLITDDPTVAYAITPFDESSWRSRPATVADLESARLLLQRSTDAQTELDSSWQPIDMSEFERDMLRPTSKWQAVKQLGRMVLADVRRVISGRS